MVFTLPHVCLFAAGAATAAIARSLSKSEATGNKAHDAAVKVVAAGMRAADVVSSATQTVADEAADVNAEARRKARIDAAVKERLDALEQEIRAEVIAEVDGAAEAE